MMNYSKITLGGEDSITSKAREGKLVQTTKFGDRHSVSSRREKDNSSKPPIFIGNPSMVDNVRPSRQMIEQMLSGYDYESALSERECQYTALFVRKILAMWLLSFLAVMCVNVPVMFYYVATIAIFIVTVCFTGISFAFLFDIFHRQHLRWRWFKIRVLFNQVQLFSPQNGEMTKEQRRDQYLKNRSFKIKDSQNHLRKRSGKKKKTKTRPIQVDKLMKPQSGMMSGGLSEAFEKMASMANVPFDNDTLDKIENLGALYAIVRESVSTTQLCGALFLYFKTHYRKSAALLAAKYLGEICDMDFSTQGGTFSHRVDAFGATFDSQSGEFNSYIKDKDKPKWLQLLKSCQENWTLVVHNEGFNKISKILSLALALGLCEASSLDFKVGGMKLFTLGATPKQASCITLIDAVFETVVYFAEGGYACFETGSIKPLLYGNMENEEFETNYGKCQQCLDYARAGNLSMAEMDESDFAQLLDSTIEKAGSLISAAKGAVEKNILRRKMDALRVWQAQFNQTRITGGLREAPYSIGVFGGTGVGKSTVANVAMVTTLLHNNYAATDDRIITLNESDKYMSNYRSYINGILLDDIGNTKAEFVEKAPTTLMIQLVNNVRMYANMAEAELKGKVSVEPRVVIGTKNVKDTCATVYSNEPASITRRDRITITVTVKEAFKSDGMLDSDKVRAHYGRNIPLIPDCWHIKVEKSYPIKAETKGKADKIGWKTVRWNGSDLSDISLPELVRFVAEDSKSFYSAQKTLVSNNNNLAKKFVLCPTCNLVTEVCCCTSISVDTDSESDDSEETSSIASSLEQALYESRGHFCDPENSDDEMSTQFGTKIATFIHQYAWKKSRKLRPLFSYWSDEVEERTVKFLIDRLDWLESSPYTVWTNWIPTDWMKHDWCAQLVWATNEKTLRERIKRSYCNQLVFLSVICFLAFRVTFGFIYLTPISLCALARVVEKEKQFLYDEVSSDNNAMPEVFKRYRDKHVKWITGVCATIAALYAVAQIWKALKVVPTPQTSLNPTSDAEIKERDEKINPWAGVIVTPMPSSLKSKTTTPDSLEKLTIKNLAYMEIEGVGGNQHFCNAFFPCSNIALIPNHMWVKDDIKAKFTRHDRSQIGGNFEAYLCKQQSVHIPNTDLSLVWVPNGGDWKSLMDYFPEDTFNTAPARFIYKRENGDQLLINEKTPRTMMTSKRVATKACAYRGATYTLPFDTFEGLCMGVLVTETNGPLFGGFHLGGYNGNPQGCSGLLTRTEIDEAIVKLKSKPGTVLSKSEGEIPTEQYGIKYY